jgi:hypothetical protein
MMHRSKEASGFIRRNQLDVERKAQALVTPAAVAAAAHLRITRR